MPQSQKPADPLIKIARPEGRLVEAHADTEGHCPEKPADEIRVIHVDSPDHVELHPIVVNDNRPIFETNAASSSESSDFKIRADWQLPPWARSPQNDTPVKFQLKKFVLSRPGSLLDMFM